MAIDVHSDQRYGRYYVGEDVIMKASIQNSTTILCMTWQKETETGSNTINTTMPRYIKTGNDTDEDTLTIKNCSESDGGSYFLLAACINNLDVYSNSVQIDVVKGITLHIFNKRYSN